MSLPVLRETLVRMHRSGLRGGLDGAHADSLVDALSSGASLAEAARRAGLDARITATLSAAGVQDLPDAILGQARVAGALESGTRRMRAAGAYPLTLAAAIVVAGAVLGGVMAPTLADLSMAGSLSAAPLWGAVGLSAVLLVLLAVIVQGRLQVPMLSGGWRALHRAAFLDSLDQLVQAGVPLPAALRGASAWCLPGQQTAAAALARSLDAGRPSGVGALLHPVEAGMLISAARAGSAPQATAALAAQQRIRLERVLPDAVMRVHAVALLLAGVGVLALGVAFMTVYGNVLAS